MSTHVYNLYEKLRPVISSAVILFEKRKWVLKRFSFCISEQLTRNTPSK